MKLIAQGIMQDNLIISCPWTYTNYVKYCLT